MRYLALLLAAGTAQAGGTPGDPLFTDQSQGFPVEHRYTGDWEHFVGGGVAVFDCNGDARPDIFAAGGTSPARLFVNEAGEDGKLKFADGTGDEITGVTGAYPVDIDSDGTLDLAVMRVGGNLLLRGQGDCKFVDATEAWGFDPGNAWTTAFSATWENGQEFPTLAVGNYVDRADPDGPFEACEANELHRPDGNRYGSPIRLEPGFCALSMLISDWQRAGTPELRISNDRHYYVKGGFEEMWRLDPLRPRTEADGWQRVSLWGMGIASGDIDGNAFPDVMLTSMGDQLLQFNDGASFSNAPFAQGTSAHRPYIGDDGRPSTGWHAEFGDVNNDGLLDLFIAKGNVDQMPGSAMQDPNNLLMQSSDGTFVEHGADAGIGTLERSRGAALADFDGDGRLDLVVVNRRAPMEIWRNETPNSGNWLEIELRQPSANTRGIGAWVEVRAGAAVMAQERTVGGGHAGGQALPLHFGLGAAEMAELRVLWPDGNWSEWIELAANRRVTIDR